MSEESERVAKMEALCPTCGAPVVAVRVGDLPGSKVLESGSVILAGGGLTHGSNVVVRYKPPPTELYQEFAETMQDLADTQSKHIAVEKILRPQPLGDAGYSITQQISQPSEVSEEIGRLQEEWFKRINDDILFSRRVIEGRLRGS